MGNRIINLQNINKSFGSQKVLNDIDLSVEQGDFVVIMGDSGAGKTTLINVLSFLDSADSGNYELFGNDVTNLTVPQKSKYRREYFNIVFQKYNLFEELTIYENLVTYAKICGIDIPNIDEQINQITESLKLNSHLGKKVNVLSQGEKQRVAIARSMLSEKKLILADEPTASVDEENRDIIIKQLIEANEQGITVIVVTHDKEYLKFATKRLFMSFGRISEME